MVGQGASVGAEAGAGPLAAGLPRIDVLGQAVDLVAAAAQQVQVLGAAAVLANHQVVARRGDGDVVRRRHHLLDRRLEQQFERLDVVGMELELKNLAGPCIAAYCARHAIAPERVRLH